MTQTVTEMRADVTAWLDMLDSATSYRISGYSDGIGSPDNHDSPGADWLRHRRDAIVDAVRNGALVIGGDIGPDDDAIGEWITGAADDANEIYTHRRWLVFADLTMYEVDIDDLRGDDTDMTELAGLAQYVAAEQIFVAMIAEFYDEYAGQHGDPDDDPDDDDADESTVDAH